MGYRTAELPPVDIDEFATLPFLRRMKLLQLHWVEAGFGTPRQTAMFYVWKIFFYALFQQKLHRLLAAFEAQLPMVSIGAVLRKRAARRVRSQLDPILFADEDRQQFFESILSFFGKLGGAFVKVNDERRQVAVGGE